MVAILLILMFSCSWAFGYTMLHPEVSYWIPVAYTAVVILGLSVPSIFEFFSLRTWNVKHNRGGLRTH